MRLKLLLSLLLIASLPLPPANAQPRFELVPLGVFGGEVESNGSCFLLRHANGAKGALMLDCATPVAGILRWKGLGESGMRWSERMSVVIQELSQVSAILLTHSHLDHLFGFILKSPLHLEGALKGTSTDVFGNAATVEAIRKSLFGSKIWVDFEKIPTAEAPAFRLRSLEEGRPKALGGFTVEAIPLNHTVPSSAFLVTAADGSAYLHLGDTGMSDRVWDRARPLLRQGRLKAVALETSFGSNQEKLAVKTGHLTPYSLVREMAKLATGRPAAASADTVILARSLAPRLRGVQILIHHIKPSCSDAVADEMDELKKAGLPVVILEQGKALRF